SRTSSPLTPGSSRSPDPAIPSAGLVTHATFSPCHTASCRSVRGVYPMMTDPGEIMTDARVDFFGNALAAKVLKHINSAGRALSDSGLPMATQELVKIRASQINGCGFCTDMHTKDAVAAGESHQR